MPSDSKKRRDAKKKEAAKQREIARKNPNQAAVNGNQTETTENVDVNEDFVRKFEKDMDLNAEYRSCTGVLGVHPRSRDIKIDNFSITFHGCEMLTDTKLGKY